MVLEFGLLQSSLFPASAAQGDGLNPDVLERMRAEEGIGVVPIGSIIAWHKDLSGVPALPDNFMECDGTAITDGDSPMLGQNTPDLNNANRFARGNTASGNTGGSATHSHTLTGTGQVQHAAGNYSASTDSKSHLPKYFNVVWIIRIK